MKLYMYWAHFCLVSICMHIKINKRQKKEERKGRVKKKEGSAGERLGHGVGERQGKEVERRNDEITGHNEIKHCF